MTFCRSCLDGGNCRDLLVPEQAAAVAAAEADAESDVNTHSDELAEHSITLADGTESVEIDFRR